MIHGPDDFSREEFNLFNPAFVAVLLAASSFGKADSSGSRDIAIPLAFVAATFGLFRSFRESLPNSTRTYLSTWVGRNPELRLDLHRLMRGSLPALRAGLLFGAEHGTLTSEGISLSASGRAPRLGTTISTETAAAIKSSQFVGRWVSQALEPATAISLLGFRP